MKIKNSAKVLLKEYMQHKSHLFRKNLIKDNYIH